MNTDFFIKQLDEIIDDYTAMGSESSHQEKQAITSRAIAAIHRISGRVSSYSNDVNRILKDKTLYYLQSEMIIGITQALRDDLRSGYLRSYAEILHAEIFADFLEMATHLLDNGYKDAAAVIIGSTLESHIKKLATKNSIPIKHEDGKSVKAEKINQDLASADVYTKLDQKNVTSWLGLRNEAAHGNYDVYTIAQVRLFVSSVQDFITRNPA